ncbi:MAG TPA: LLM class F420-dependent oxidoreductase [Rubrobacteraceae bacterium]|nr:LLM class F420-dependent oxidoreductase [Rubrobacteraceae bacterium]
MAVKFGVFVPQGWRMDLVEIKDPVEQYEAMTRVARVAEESGGYDSAWVYDHFHTVPTPEKETTFECWTISAGLSRDTKKIKIGQMVTCNGYRNPALLAKMASTVDVMSHGRLLFGLGAGWYKHEWRAYGYGFPKVPERMRAFREACEIIHRMWTEDEPVFDGEFYTINKPINEPKGVSSPHPPFWIGGSGEKVTLRLVARWGDACNVGGDIDRLKHKFDVLKRHCDDVGRNYEEITRSTSINVYLLEKDEDPEAATKAARGSRSYEEYSREFMVGTADEISERLAPMVEAGVGYFITYLPRVAYDPAPVEHFAKEVIPNFA